MNRKRFAVLLAGLDKEYQQDYVAGLEETAGQMDADLLVFACQGFPESARVINEDSESRIFDLPDLGLFDGVAVLTNTIPDRDAARRLEDRLAAVRHIPQVFLDKRLNDDTDTGYATHIGFDDAVSISALMDHMIKDHGCRTFALVTGPVGNVVSDARTETCREKLREHQCALLMEYDGRWTHDGGRRAAEALLELPALPEAVVCGNDDMAISLIDRLEEAGLRVPEDIRVTGFDARRDMVAQGLTSIRRPVREAGSLTARLLADPKEQSRRLSLPTELVLGTSCGCGCSHSNEYLKRVCTERRAMERSLLCSATFTSMMATADNEQEGGEVISQFAHEWGMKEMYVVAAPAFFQMNAEDDGQHSYPEELLMLAGIDGAHTETNTVFGRTELLPGLMKRETPVSLAFMPLYYQDRTIGYMVTDVTYGSSKTLLTLMTLIDCSLMELSQRCTIRRYAAMLESLYIHDPLTGLYNRRGFYQQAEKLMEKAENADAFLAVISIDMDGMKHINDHYGHLYGDEAIRRMGRVVKEIENEDTVCSHMSGDEFMVVALGESREAMLHIVDRLQEGIARMNRDQPWICDLSASIGIYAAQPTRDDNLPALIHAADNRMYENKRERKARMNGGDCRA